MQETNKKQQNKKGQKSIMKSFLKTFTSFSQVMPMFVGVILLMGLFNTFITKEMITSVFTGNMFSDIPSEAMDGLIECIQGFFKTKMSSL